MNESEHILFSAGGINLAADAASIHCVHDSLNAQSEDGTPEWFLGVAVADERLLPITDLGAYLQGYKATGRVIEVAKELGIAGLKIDAVHGVSGRPLEPVDVDGTTEFSDNPLQAKAVRDQGQQYRLIDIASLMQSSRFLNLAPELA